MNLASSHILKSQPKRKNRVARLRPCVSVTTLNRSVLVIENMTAPRKCFCGMKPPDDAWHVGVNFVHDPDQLVSEKNPELFCRAHSVERPNFYYTTAGSYIEGPNSRSMPEMFRGLPTQMAGRRKGA